MKKFVLYISILLCTALSLSPFASAETLTDDEVAADGVLNISPISEEQAELCTAVMLDGFEGDETERSASQGTLSSFSVSALEGERCLNIAANNKAEMTVTLTKRRSTANTRSLCVCAYVDPAEGATFDMTVTVRGAEAVITGSASILPGQWMAAYLPINTENVINIESVTVCVSANSDTDERVSCLIDRIHTATVDGLPDRLKYFASDFTANRGDIEYTDDALVFRPAGSNSYIESLPCGYMTNGRYNALSFVIENNCDAENMILRLKLDRQYSYTEENSHTLALSSGEHIYSFPIGGFRSGTSVGAFRLEFPGNVSGEISIKSISFSSYRFPPDYHGTVNAEITGGKLCVYGTLPDYPASTTRVCLYKLVPGFDEEEPGGFDAEPYATAPASSSFRFELPLTENTDNNAYFKYLVRYETETGYEDAGVAYVGASQVKAPEIPYKGISAPADTSLLSYVLPDAVYADVDLAEILTGDGDTEFKFAGSTGHISSAALEKYDALIQRCADDKLFTVLRLVYTPFAGSEKYYFISDNSALPDITTAEGAAHYMSLLSFFAQRYEGKLSAVIPCTALNSKETAALRGMTADKAEKYAADLIFAAQSAVSSYGVSVIAPVASDDAELFLGMLKNDVKEPENFAIYMEADTAESAKDLLSSVAVHDFKLIISADTESAADLVHLYCGCKGAAGVCARGIDFTDSRAKLYSVIDTSYGAAAADRLAADGFPDGVASVYPDIESSDKRYDDAGELQSAELPQMLTAVYDGKTLDNWQSYDCCKSIYQAPVNGEDAAALAFDFTSGCFGYAAYRPQTRKKYGVVYFRLYADYLPEDTEDVRLRILAEGDKAVTAGYCTLEKENTFVVCMDLSAMGRIDRFTFAPVDVQDKATPRICVLGIYISGSGSSETLTEAQTETLPEPETQIFETAEVMKDENSEKNSIRLYTVSIFVIIGMFLLCGLVILLLKKRDLGKTDVQNKP